jgi:hypothetical protein
LNGDWAVAVKLPGVDGAAESPVQVYVAGVESFDLLTVAATVKVWAC